MKRKSRKRRLNKVRLFLAILIFAVIVIFIINKPKTNEVASSTNDISTNDKAEQTTSMSLIMVGDNLIHESVYKDANRHANGNGYDFKPMITRIKEKVQKYDLAYFNQETILGGTKLNLSGYPTFNSPYEVGDAMIDAGFNLVSTATNHAMDKGEQGILNSRAYWDEKEDVLVAGTYKSAEQKEEIQIKEKKRNYIYNVKLYLWN